MNWPSLGVVWCLLGERLSGWGGGPRGGSVRAVFGSKSDLARLSYSNSEILLRKMDQEASYYAGIRSKIKIRPERHPRHTLEPENASPWKWRNSGGIQQALTGDSVRIHFLSRDI